MSNGLGPERHPDLGPNCLQRLSADDKSRRYWHQQGNSLVTSFFASLSYMYMNFIFVFSIYFFIFFGWGGGGGGRGSL